MTDFNLDMTVREAQNVLRALLDEGHVCPVCTQFAKVYRFGFNAAMARGLISMYQRGRRGWVNVPELGLPGGHMLKARFWRLIEKPEELIREDGSTRVGIWRVTEEGERFVLCRMQIASHARIYNNRCLGLAGRSVDIQQVLGKRFNYHELMMEHPNVA